MIGLAEAMADRGHNVSYTVIPNGQKLRRQEIGWPALSNTSCSLLPLPSPEAADELAEASPIGTVHLFQGLRGRTVLEHGLKAV